MMKNILIVPFLLFGLVTFGQQAEETLITKPPNELKPFKFELEYTPLSDIQPVLLLRTTEKSYVGIKFISSSFIFNEYSKLRELFQKKPYWGFQTSLFIHLSSDPLLELNYTGQSDFISLIYRVYSNNQKTYYDFGGFISTGILKRKPHLMGNSGIEISVFHKYNSIWLGSSLQMGPIINLSEDRFFYSGFGICLNYFIIKFNLY